MGKEKQSRKFYSAEFKSEALGLAKRVGASEAARQLGIHPSSIGRWNKESEGPEKSSGGSTGGRSYKEIERENRRLIKENGYLKEINRVLKKSTAIFSNDQMGFLR